MAVYTHVPAEEMAQFLTRYDTGALVSAKGIAEGVENSNYMLETRRPDGEAERFILTLYEKRVDEADLPFFMDLLDHLSLNGCKVPRFIADRDGRKLQQLAGRPACLIEFLSGISVTEPTPRNRSPPGGRWASCTLPRAASRANGATRSISRAGTISRRNAAIISMTSSPVLPRGWRRSLPSSMPTGPRILSAVSSMRTCSPIMY